MVECRYYGTNCEESNLNIEFGKEYNRDPKKMASYIEVCSKGGRRCRFAKGTEQRLQEERQSEDILSGKYLF